jgi:3-hydroxyisobutyrate dehydrogenase-like beta-hydroxyacid dehydrogenase
VGDLRRTGGAAAWVGGVGIEELLADALPRSALTNTESSGATELQGQDMTSTATLGFIGLGVMGSGMCRNVVKKHGGRVHAFDLDVDALVAMVKDGAIAATSVAEVAKAAEIVFLSLPGGNQVGAVCEEIATHAKPGLTVVDMSTTGVAEARAIAASLEAKGVHFVDAPVARTRQAAIDGTLAIMVGASEDKFARLKPLLDYMGQDVMRCGETGCGQVMKLVNNTLVFEQVAALAEMFVVAERAGVAPATMADVLSKSSADSFALRNHGVKSMVPRDFPEKSFPAAYVVKDLTYAMELARAMGVEPRLTEITTDYFSQVDKAYGDRYYPALVELIDKEQPQ